MTKEIFDAYVSDGWHVFALYRTTDGKGNAVKGMYATPKGWNDMSKPCFYDPNKIYAGIPPKDIVAIDYDVKNGKVGAKSFAQLQKDFNVNLDTTVISPSGGGHAYVRLKNLPDETPKLKKAQDKYPDIDFQSHGSEFVVLGGQIVEGYGEYEFVDEDFEYYVNPAVDFSSLELRGERIQGDGYNNIDVDEHFLSRPPLEQVEEWLSKLDPDMGHDEGWVDVIRALNSWDLNGEEGLRLAIEWSQKATKYKSTAEEIAEKYYNNVADAPEFYNKLIGLVNKKSKKGFNSKIAEAKEVSDLKNIAEEISKSDISNADREKYVNELSAKCKEISDDGKPQRVTWKNAVKKKVELDESSILLPDYYKSDKGVVYLNTLDNLVAFVEHISSLEIKYDVILKRVIINDTYNVKNAITQEEAYSILFSELTRKRIGSPSTMLSQHFASMVFSNKQNALLKFITDLPEWDGETDYIGRVASTIKTEVATEEYKHEVMKCFCIQAVASWDARERSNHPMSRLDNVMTFVGKQGSGKTTWFSKLMPDFMINFFKDGVELDPSNKDSYIEATQAGLVELGELDATNRKSDISSLKAFLSRTVDEFRAPYGRASERYARQTVFVGTVNNSDFLKDATGSRRFMVLDATEITMPSTEDVLGMWSQALALYLKGENWLLSSQWQEVRNEINKGYTDLGNIGDFGAEIIDANNKATGKITPMRLGAIAKGFNHPIRNNRERSDLSEFLINHDIKKYPNGTFGVKADIFEAHKQLQVEQDFADIEDNF